MKKKCDCHHYWQPLRYKQIWPSDAASTIKEWRDRRDQEVALESLVCLM